MGRPSKGHIVPLWKTERYDIFLPESGTWNTLSSYIDFDNHLEQGSFLSGASDVADCNCVVILFNFLSEATERSSVPSIRNAASALSCSIVGNQINYETEVCKNDQTFSEVKKSDQTPVVYVN